MDRKKTTIKVLHLIEGLGSGGAEKLLYTNLKYFDTEKVSSEVVTVFSNQDYWKEKIENLNVPVYALDCKNYRSIATGAIRLLRLVQENKPDLIHTHLWTANIIGRIVGWWTGIPVLSSIHNPEYEPQAFTSAKSLNSKKLLATMTLDKWTAGFGCDRMLAVSRYVKESTHQRLNFPLEKIQVIYNPIDTSDLGRRRSRQALLNDLQLPPDSICLLNVGRLAPQKGFIYAVRAMKKVQEHFPNANLISIGSQSDKQWLSIVEQEINNLGLADVVHLVGEKRGISDFLHDCDLFVFPSLFEGLGIALAEAMAIGCACITNDIKPLNEFVIKDVNGILIEPRDPDALAAAIIDLLGNAKKRDELGQAAKETALNLFQPQPAADRLVELYVSMAGREMDFRSPLINPPRISLVIPVLDEAESIGMLFESINIQTLPPDEIIVVDGGSKDATVLLIEKFARENVKIKLIKTDGATPGKGRNIGIESAGNDMIALTDAGTRLEAEWLEELVRVSAKTPELDIIFGNYTPVIDKLFEKCSALSYVPPQNPNEIRGKFVASCLLKKKVWESVGGFPDLRAAEDLIFMEKAAKQGFKTGFAPHAMVHSSLRPSISTTFAKFVLYSKHNVWAGRQWDWHYGILKQYLLLLPFLILAAFFGPWWWLAAIPSWLIIRAAKRILANRYEFGLGALFNPLVLFGTAVLVLTIDMATFVGWVMALVSKK